MASLQDLRNLCLWRLRQRGVAFGASPTNSPTDQNPPYLVDLLLNMGYSEFLSRTIEASIATLKTSFLTTASATRYPLSPLPNTPLGAANPAALRVVEATYTTATGGINAGYEYRVDLVSSARFGALSGSYTRRLSWFGSRVLYAARLYRQPFLEVLPGTATANDTISLTIVPDPNASPAGVTAANGGKLVSPTDAPLFPQQFHMALVEYVVANAGDASNKNEQVQAASARWEQYIADALNEGGTEDGGDPYRLVDTWGSPIAREGF